MRLEALSKAAAIVSVVAIVLLQLAVHPDLTPALRALSALGLIGGWLGARAFPRSILALWVALAILTPGLLRLLTGREGPVLDMFWMAGLTAALLRTASWSRWALPEGWRVLAGGWALTLALAWPVLVARETGFDVARLTDLGAINAWAGPMLSAPHVVAWTLFVVWTHLLGLLWLDALAAQYTADDMPRAVHGFWVATTIASLVAVYQGTIDIAFLSTPFWTPLARATGTMLDPNAYGTCAALAGPIGYLALQAYRTRVASRLGSGHVPRFRPGQALACGVAVVAINLAGLWMSGSRAAWLCGVLSTAALLIGIWRTSEPGVRRVIPLAVAGAVAAVAALVFVSDAVGPVQRLAEISTSPRAALNTALNRPPYGPTALQIIRDYPASGVGVGSYQIISADYVRRLQNAALPFDTAQNWWRHEAAELGVLGGLALFAWSAAIAWRVIAGATRPGHVLEATIVRGLLVAIGVCAFIQMQTQTPVVLLWFFLLVAWLPAVTHERAIITRVDGRRTRAAWMVVAALAVAYSGAHLALARGPLAAAERARRAHREYIVGTYPPEPFPDSGSFRWTRAEAHFALPARSPWFVVRLWAAHPDIKQKPVHVTLATPCGVLFSRDLRSHDQVSIGVVLPEGEDEIDAAVAVSRTWQPADFEGRDTRRLGVGIVADFVDSHELAVSQMHTATWPICPASKP